MGHIIDIAYNEELVSWSSQPSRVKQYIDAATFPKKGVSYYNDRSWCTDFVYWVLMRAGVSA